MTSIESVSSIPRVGSPLPALRAAAATCHACPLWRNATQTVFGEGPLHAPLFLIGEQPGDEEDRAGHPFVGPGGTAPVPGCSPMRKSGACKGPSPNTVCVALRHSGHAWQVAAAAAAPAKGYPARLCSETDSMLVMRQHLQSPT